MSITWIAGLNVDMATETCCSCGIVFAMPLDWKRRRVNDHANFWCPAGHSQHYTGPTEVQKLQSKLDEANRTADNLRAARNAAQEQAERERIERKKLATRHRHLKTRIKNGVCPCCNRQFASLLQHIRQEHPDYVVEKEAE